ncbi:membrane protein DedA, SNARE-associated domain [Palleronia salina]|uniref:Membrane protein DedA, SNARE-associated domain n=1 Tax=Palleronia salina TaxID=313368 RepID=A0A1M6KJN9_9RHOB|nr:VTT domain-containing protein [Palleronia salina]SHJ59050.1 membrane protein DedA, SNARE-associated domain [Palleronia salina]
MDIAGSLARWGVLFVYLGCVVEGDAVAISAGVLADQGRLPFWPVVFAAALGAWTWDMGIFTAGRIFRGHPRIARALEHPRAQRVTRRLLRRPWLLAGIFRFIPATRTVAPLALATGSSIRAATYAAITGPACLLWAMIAVTIGADLSRLLSAVWREARSEMQIAAALALGGVAIFAWRRWSLARARAISRTLDDPER